MPSRHGTATGEFTVYLYTGAGKRHKLILYTKITQLRNKGYILLYCKWYYSSYTRRVSYLYVT